MAFPTYQTLAQKETVQPTLNASALDARTPASIPPAPSVKVAKAHSHFHSMDLNCKKSATSSFKVVGAFLQFQGKNCGPSLKDGDVEIINKSNGFTASVFTKGSNQYQTDLIQLKEGDNQILIRYRPSTGQPVEQTMTVTSSAI